MQTEKTEKRRGRHVYSLVGSAQPELWMQTMEKRLEELMHNPAAQHIRKGLPAMGMCLAAAQGRLAGGSTPFAAALMAAVMCTGGCVGWAAGGWALGALIAGDVAQLPACALLYALYLCLHSADLEPNELTCVMAAGACVMPVPLLTAQNLYDAVTALTGGFAAMVLTKLCLPALRLHLRRRKLLDVQEGAGIALLAAMLAAGLRSVQIAGASPVTAGLMLLCIGAGYLGGAGLGAAAGVLMGLMLGVTEPAATHLFAGLALLGILCGLFGRMGRGWAAAAAPLAAMLAAGLQEGFLTVGRAAELAAAMGVFLCLPERVWAWLRGYLDREVQLREEARLSQAGLRGELCTKITEYAGLYGRMARAVGGSGGQFSAVSTALTQMAQELAQPAEPLMELSCELARALDAAELEAQNVQARQEGGQLRVSMCIACRRRDGLCDGRLTQAVSRAAGRAMRLRPTGICPKAGLCALEWETASRFEVSIGCASGAAQSGQPCGDTLTAVQLPQERYLLALADGMGHGKAAQAESRAAVDLMEDFLLAGFEPEAALHGVNEQLLRQDDGEHFSTMDLALADLAGGGLRVMKIGAVPSYIRRGKRILRISGDALPMGIVERVKPSVTQLQLQDGDVLMMISDGVLDALGGDETLLQAELLRADIRVPDHAAHGILESAKAAGEVCDDMTVCLMRVAERRKIA